MINGKRNQRDGGTTQPTFQPDVYREEAVRLLRDAIPYRLDCILRDETVESSVAVIRSICDSLMSMIATPAQSNKDSCAPSQGSLVSTAITDSQNVRIEHCQLEQSMTDEILQHIAAFPLEEIHGLNDAQDDRIIYGANRWKLNVGHIRTARRLCAGNKNSAAAQSGQSSPFENSDKLK